MAALDGAIAFAEMQSLAVRIGQNLEFDVPRFLDVLLDINRAVAEGLFGFAAGDVVFLCKRNVVVGDAHPASAAARHRLDDDRIADLAGNLYGLGLGFYRSIRSGNDRDARFSDRVLGDGLVAHHLDRL
jgi:hypothetical protein